MGYFFIYLHFAVAILFATVSCSSKNKINEDQKTIEEKCSKFNNLKKQNEIKDYIKEANLSQKNISYCKRQKSYESAVEYFQSQQDEDDTKSEDLKPVLFSQEVNIADPTPEANQSKSKILSLLNHRMDLEISQEIPVKDLLFDIASTYDIDIQIMQDIDSQIAISVSDKKIIDVFKIIAKNANLRFSIDDESISFEKDTPFVKNYILTLLDSVKTGSDSYGVGSGVGSGIGSGSSGNSNQGSSLSNSTQANQNSSNQSSSSSGVSASSHISNTTEWSVWKSFEDGLRKILESYKDSSFNINKQAGIITINAPTKGHKDAIDYIEKIRRYAMTQILVEVKLVELTLDDQYKTGVDFTSTLASNGSSSVTKGFSSISLPFSVAGASSFGFSKLGDTNIDSAINLLQKFGVTKVVSSPRINVVNNQKAVLSFASDKVYFQITPTLQNQFTAVGSLSNPTNPIIVNSTVKSIPVGMILSLQAVANPDNNEITLNIRPSLSSSNSADDVPDPAATFLSGYNTGSATNPITTKVTNAIPIVKKKELDSVMKIQSGGVMVLGGFTEETFQDIETGVPFLMSIPLFGYLFKSKTKISTNTETIIFVKANIVPSTSVEVLSTKDKTFYDIFG